MTHRRPIIQANGYRVRLLDGGGLVVTNPEDKEYHVSPRRRTCSCPAGVFKGQCRHLELADALLELMEHNDQGI